jgi:hypothetical protein
MNYGEGCVVSVKAEVAAGVVAAAMNNYDGVDEDAEPADEEHEDVGDHGNEALDEAAHDYAEANNIVAVRFLI